MDLIQDAVCLNDDDEAEFKPVAYQKQANVEVGKNDMIYINTIDADKKGENKQQLSCSEGLTDMGDQSPNKEKDNECLQVEKKHYYDPHEPHSA